MITLLANLETDLIIVKMSHHTQFNDLDLLCLSHVYLQAEGGKISLEGTVCEDYYKVRHLLYEQFAII